MKHLLTAALVAIALASPVRGEEVYISCFPNNENTDPPFGLKIDTSTWSAVFTISSGREIPAETLFINQYGNQPVTWVVNWGENGIDSPDIVILQRSTLRAVTSYIGESALFANFPLIRFYQCVRPL